MIPSFDETPLSLIYDSSFELVEVHNNATSDTDSHSMPESPGLELSPAFSYISLAPSDTLSSIGDCDHEGLVLVSHHNTPL